jgi:hypothetical protein
MQHKHADIIIQHVTNTSRVLLYKSFETAEWFTCAESAGLHHFTGYDYFLAPEQHKCVALSWLNGEKIEMLMPDDTWEVVDSSVIVEFFEDCEYRVKPSGLIDVWVGTQKEDKSATIAIPAVGSAPKMEGFTFTKVSARKEI